MPTPGHSCFARRSDGSWKEDKQHAWHIPAAHDVLDNTLVLQLHQQPEAGVSRELQCFCGAQHGSLLVPPPAPPTVRSDRTYAEVRLLSVAEGRHRHFAVCRI